MSSASQRLQTRPLPQERLVGDLDRVLVDRHQAALDENREGGCRLLVAFGLQL